MKGQTYDQDMRGDEDAPRDDQAPMKRVRVSVDAAWSDDRRVLCYIEDPANPAVVVEQHEPYARLNTHRDLKIHVFILDFWIKMSEDSLRCREKDAQETFTQRAQQVDFHKHEGKGSRSGGEEGSEVRAHEAQKKREERFRQEAIRRDTILDRMRSAYLHSPSSMEFATC